MSVVTLPYEKLKAWKKLWLEGTTVNWTEPQRVAVPQINVGSEVAAVVSMSLSQTEIFFVRGAKMAMKMNGAIAGDSETEQKKFTAR